MGIFDSTINRIYKCENKECEAVISCVEKVSDDWQVKCPFCKKKSLYLDSGVVNVSVFMEPSVPKTFGTQAEKNTKELIKRDESVEDPYRNKYKPWWRKGKKKIDYKVLRDPNKYIHTGKA